MYFNLKLIFISFVIVIFVDNICAAPTFQDELQQQLQQTVQEHGRVRMQLQYDDNDDYFNDVGGYYGIDRVDDGDVVVSSPIRYQYRPVYRYKHTHAKKKRKKLFVLNTWG